MSERIAAVVQVGDALAWVLGANENLSSFTIINDLSSDVATDETDGETVRLFLTAHSFENQHMMGQTRHVATYEIEVATRASIYGSLDRRSLNAIADIVAAIAADRTLGGKVEDIQEVDTASAIANGKDASGASIQFQTVFYTSRSDWSILVT